LAVAAQLAAASGASPVLSRRVGPASLQPIYAP